MQGAGACVNISALSASSKDFQMEVQQFGELALAGNKSWKQQAAIEGQYCFVLCKMHGACVSYGP